MKKYLDKKIKSLPQLKSLAKKIFSKKHGIGWKMELSGETQPY